MAKREHVVVETNNLDAAVLARILRETGHAWANTRHRGDLDAEDFEALVQSEASKKGPVDVEVRSAVRPGSNAVCYFVIVAPQGKAKAAADKHVRDWR